MVQATCSNAAMHTHFSFADLQCCHPLTNSSKALEHALESTFMSSVPSLLQLSSCEPCEMLTPKASMQDFVN